MKVATGLTLAASAALVLGLSACKKEAEAPKTAAGGELLPRSVGDEMLPYDTVKSQAPLASPDGALPGLGGIPRGEPGADASAAAGENEDVVVPETPSPDASPEVTAQ
ncbi:hypothetical protein WSK_0669 [Novosphingobium sp. Rr 2-17]|uniref:hypothetical protein n=1 Tax=Novosphingobium sp. Rr 2-17 TaxID=555793 RepID=UPI0002697AF0|nr:hypothetical protein [Novosphingobium sp. Rr 2-17]EIZ80696.1 hypothetical protein WSK_0669 [Novosphingobium sp. Rr 2-17]